MKKISEATLIIVASLNLLTNLKIFLRQYNLYDSLCHRIQNNRELSLDIYNKIKLGEEDERNKKMDREE